VAPDPLTGFVGGIVSPFGYNDDCAVPTAPLFIPE
jgi:hypothetical protein